MDLDQIPRAPVAYLVHDLADAAVRRRTALFEEEGLVVHLAGFRRRKSLETGMPRHVCDLGTTKDARLMSRALAVLRLLCFPQRVRDACAGAQTIVARNLEMLLIAQRIRRPGQRVVYECLDIHRLMLGWTVLSKTLRTVERRLLSRTDMVMVSSPAFAREYFVAKQGALVTVIIVENKVAEAPLPLEIPAPKGKRPIVIGWFGMLRCRRTLQQLMALVEAGAGRIEVIIAGIPSPAVFTDFADQVEPIDRITYIGPYTAADLTTLYDRVDLIWAIDYFEEGLNSEWLLPNRLYEGLSRGAVPIALKRVETGRWLAKNGVGLLIDDADNELAPLLSTLTERDLHDLRAAIASLPRELIHQTPAERRAIVDAVTGVTREAA